MNLGVITDGISRDFAHALTVMDAFGLEYAELQFLWDKEVGNLGAGERRKALELIARHEKRVACISAHLFGGVPTTTTCVGDALHTHHLDWLGRCIDMAHEFGSPLVRIMSGRNEPILWGSHGAEQWNVAKGAWEGLLALLAPAVELARSEGITLVVETGNGGMVHSGYTGRRLVDDLDARNVLKVLWDPANACWGHETAYPDGYRVLRDGYLGHLHIKDVIADTPRSHLEVRELGTGQLAHQFPSIAEGLRSDSYDGVISLESVYHPGNGDFEAGFRASIGAFTTLFG